MAQGKPSPVKSLANSYFAKDVVADFSSVKFEEKLTILQVTPPKYIKERELGGKTVKFIEHTYAKKCLNFVFNFLIDSEVVKEDWNEYMEEYYDYKDKNCKKSQAGKIIPIKKERPVVEASVVMKFTMTYPDGSVHSRTVRASHKGYQNPALTKSNIMEAAHSKTWSKLAATFGIGSELDKVQEDKAYDDAVEAEVVDDTPPAKAFDNNVGF